MPIATIAGAPLYYADAGSGRPAVVLLHAFPLHGAMWEEQVATLSGRWRVIVPDLPGFGSTPPPLEPRATTIDGYADVVAALVEHLGVAPVVVAGLSMGGYVTFALLRRHRHLVQGVVLADTRAGADSDEVAARRTSQQDQAGDEGTAELVESMLGTLLSEETRTRRTDVVERARALMAGHPVEGWIAALEAMKGRPDATDELAGIDVPALVMVGEHDPSSPPAEAEAMASAIPDARLEVLPAAAHLSNLEAPEAFDRALETFLARL